MPRIGPFEKYTSRYDNWFEKNRPVYKSELEALRISMPRSSRSLEIGVGSGRFAVPLGILYGLDPSPGMINIARKRGIRTVCGVAEKLPFKDSTFDLVMMVTTICFLDDAGSAFKEVYRILSPGGAFIVGFIDKNSSLGRTYQEKKMYNVFYQLATFYSVDDIMSLLKEQNFNDFNFVQTIFHGLEKIKNFEPVINGYGEGSFVVIRTVK